MACKLSETKKGEGEHYLKKKSDVRKQSIDVKPRGKTGLKGTQRGGKTCSED